MFSYVEPLDEEDESFGLATIAIELNYLDLTEHAVFNNNEGEEITLPELQPQLIQQFNNGENSSGSEFN